MADVHPVPTADRTDKADLYGGIALGIATFAALVIANSRFGPQYSALFQATGEIRIGPVGLAKSVEHWINDGLMAIFFLLVGLEIKREVIEGSLAGCRRRPCPCWRRWAGSFCRRRSMPR